MDIETIEPLENQPFKQEHYLMKNNNVKLEELLTLLDEIRDSKNFEWRQPRLEIYPDGSGFLRAINSLKRFQMRENGEDSSTCPDSKLGFLNLEDFLEKGQGLLDSF